jgi:hypothetical protein
MSFLVALDAVDHGVKTTDVFGAVEPSRSPILSAARRVVWNLRC